MKNIIFKRISLYFPRGFSAKDVYPSRSFDIPLLTHNQFIEANGKGLSLWGPWLGPIAAIRKRKYPSHPQ
jgi:hypothetical protein